MKWLHVVQSLDIQAFNWCMTRRHRVVLTAWSRAISRSADGWLYLAFFFAYGVFQPQDGILLAESAGIAFAIERTLYWTLKNTCRRCRPADALDDFMSFIVPGDTFSFPSGHTSAAFLFAVLVSSQFPGLLPTLIVWSTAVALSRIFLGVHFPTDTLVGALLGSSIGLLVLGGVAL